MSIRYPPKVEPKRALVHQKLNSICLKWSRREHSFIKNKQKEVTIRLHFGQMQTEVTKTVGELASLRVLKSRGRGHHSAPLCAGANQTINLG